MNRGRSGTREASGLREVVLSKGELGGSRVAESSRTRLLGLEVVSWGRRDSCASQGGQERVGLGLSDRVTLWVLMRLTKKPCWREQSWGGVALLLWPR